MSTMVTSRPRSAALKAAASSSRSAPNDQDLCLLRKFTHDHGKVLRRILDTGFWIPENPLGIASSASSSAQNPGSWIKRAKPRYVIIMKSCSGSSSSSRSFSAKGMASAPSEPCGAMQRTRGIAKPAGSMRSPSFSVPLRQQVSCLAAPPYGRIGHRGG